MLNIIVAPKECCFNAEKITKTVVKFLKTEKVEYSVYFSKSLESIKESVKELVSLGESEFVAVGNDVVLNTIISSVKDVGKIKLGIVPTSKKNDFARGAGISLKPIQAIKDILQKNIESVDFLVVNDMPVLNTVSIGASVETFHQFNQFKLKNFLTYQFAARKYGNKYQGIDLSIENKGKIKKETVFEMVIANGGYIKGKPASPLSNLKDGLFNVNYSTVSQTNSKKRFLKKINRGTHIYDEDTHQYWMNRLKITNSENKIKAIIDGKIHNLEELNISIIENGLKIFKSKQR